MLCSNIGNLWTGQDLPWIELYHKTLSRRHTRTDADDLPTCGSPTMVAPPFACLLILPHLPPWTQLAKMVLTCHSPLKLATTATAAIKPTVSVFVNYLTDFLKRVANNPTDSCCREKCIEQNRSIEVQYILLRWNPISGCWEVDYMTGLRETNTPE